MTPEQKAAYVNAQAVSAMAEILGMHWQNKSALLNGAGVRFHQEDFLEVIEKYGIHHNAVHSYTHT